MKPRELLMTAATFFLVAVGLGLGMRSLAMSRAEQQRQSAFVSLSTLRRGDESELIDRVFSGVPEAMVESCTDLVSSRPELLAVGLYGPTFQPLAGAAKAEGVAVAQTPGALATSWVQQAESAQDTAHGFIDEHSLVYLAPLWAAGQPLAYLRIDYDLSSIDGGRQQLVLTVVISVLTTLAVHVFLLTWVRRKPGRKRR